MVILYKDEYWLITETSVNGDKLKIFHPGRLEFKEISKNESLTPTYLGCANIFESYAKSRLDTKTS
jgi:hypothetical protein